MIRSVWSIKVRRKNFTNSLIKECFRIFVASSRFNKTGVTLPWLSNRKVNLGLNWISHSSFLLLLYTGRCIWVQIWLVVSNIVITIMCKVIPVLSRLLLIMKLLVNLTLKNNFILKDWKLSHSFSRLAQFSLFRIKFHFKDFNFNFISFFRNFLNRYYYNKLLSILNKIQ